MQHDPESSASPGSISTGTSTTLSMYCSWCASAVFWTACAVASVSPRARPFRAFKPFLGLSATAAHDLVNVVHLWDLDRLLSHTQARLDRCCRQRRSDRLLLHGSDVSEVRFVLASHVLHGAMRDLVFHCLAIELLIQTVVAAATCFCRVLIVVLILACSLPAVGPLFSTLVLVGAAGDLPLYSSVRRVLHDVLFRGELFACVQHAHSRAARGLLGPLAANTAR